MGFVGPVTQMGDAWVRPHDIELLEDEEDGCVLAELTADPGAWDRR